MKLDINWYKLLPEQEKQRCKNELEQDHRVAQGLLEQAKKSYAKCLEEEKPSSADIATIIRHLDKCKEEIKDLEEDLGKISKYSKNYSYGGTTTTTTVGCDDRDPYVALTSILGNGVVQIRPGDLCQFVAAGTKTYQNILDDLQKEKEANERHKWAWHQTEYSRPTKQEQFEQKDQREQREREQKEQKEQREREQREQKEQKAKGAQ